MARVVARAFAISGPRQFFRGPRGPRTKDALLPDAVCTVWQIHTRFGFVLLRRITGISQLQKARAFAMAFNGADNERSIQWLHFLRKQMTPILPGP
jgi:hypothetical protein